MTGTLISVAAATLLFVVIDRWLRRPTDCHIAIDRTARTPWRALPSMVGHNRWRCQVTLRNGGRRDQGLVADASGEVRWLARSGQSLASLNTRVLISFPGPESRKDGYVPATPVPPQGALSMQVEVLVAGSGADLEQILAGVVRVSFRIYTRHSLTTSNVELVLPVGLPTDQPAAVLHEGVQMQPISTHLLSEQDDLVAVVTQYAGNRAQAGDVVVLAETAVAIVQGRYFRPEEIKPGFWARRLCRFFPLTGSLGTQFTLQALMNEEGTARVVRAALIGFLAKLAGQSGAFYRWAGDQARLVDDLTGTLPPFDKYIVLGPANPQQAVDEVYRRTGLATAIVDANDGGEAYVLAASIGIDRHRLQHLLRRNPQGNEAQQTPLVLIRALEKPLVAAMAFSESASGGPSRVKHSPQVGRP